MLNIYYGSEQSDREKFIFDNVKGKTLLLVPDQFSLQAERDAFFYLNKKSLMDLRVVDFSTLGHKVVHQVGGETPKLIDKYGRHMLLAGITSKLEDKLTVYKGKGRKNSFIDMLNSVISEMKRYDVTPHDLSEAIELMEESSYLKYKLQDILSVYEDYQEAVEGKYLDSEDYITFYGNKIPRAEMVRESEVWIYGFDTFSPKNMQVIARLMQAAKNVHIVMTYEKDKEIFELTGYVIAQIKAIAEASGIDVNEEMINGEQRKTVWNAVDGDFPVTLSLTSNIYAEADRAAAFILEMVRDEGYKFGDMVVVCNDMETRGNILKRTFMRWGIPVFMDKKRKVLHHQAIGFLLALMEVISKGYRNGAMLRLMKSDIMGFDDDDREELENYVNKFRIRSAMWKNDFTKTGSEYDAEALNRLNDMRKALVNVVETARNRMGSYNTAEEKVRGLYDFLENDIVIIQRLEDMVKKQEEMGLTEIAAQTAQSWDVICNILDQIVETVGSDRISGEDLMKLMTAGFEEVEIGLVPVTSDCVIIGTLQRTRLSRLKALLIVGANEGILPLDRSDEGLITQREKETLQAMDIEIAKRDEVVRQEEKLAVYRALHLPQEKLYISCCATDEKGEAARPSEVFTGVESYLQSPLLLGDLDKTECFMDMVTSKEGTLSYLADALRRNRDGEAMDENWFSVMKWYEDQGDEGFAITKKGMLFDNRVESMGGEFANSLYRGDSEILEVSASRLEQYSRCPFAHFIMYGLRAEEPRLYEVGAREIGDIYHRCLMKLSRRLTPDKASGIAVTDEKSMWMTITEEQCMDIVKEIIKEDAGNYREGLLNTGKEEEYRAERIGEICGNIAWSMIQQVRKGRIKDMRFEQPFGSGKLLPPVKVDIGGRQVFIRGTIDRMDMLESVEACDDSDSADIKEAVRIIDYKTGEDTVDPEYFAKGYKLQLMVYLKAALEAKGNDADPAGVFYFKIKDIDTDADLKAIPKDKEAAENRVADAYRLEGIVLNDENIINSMDREIETASHVIPVKVSRKDGGFVPAAGGHLFSKEEFEKLYEQVDKQVNRICRELCDGNIGIKPKREKNKDMEGNYRNACKYCKYGSICMFDTSFDGCNYEKI